MDVIPLFLILIFITLSMTVYDSDAKCPIYCKCDMMAFTTDCKSVNSTARLDEVAKNVDSDMEELSFKGNGLTSFDSQFRLEYLIKLDLTGNLLTSVPFNLSKQFPSLRILLLDDNLIETLSAGDFIGMKYLIKLSLTNNKLSTLGDGTFIHMPKLRQLILNDNQISSLSSGCLQGMKSLVKLSLDKNKISVLPSNIFDSFQNFESGTMAIFLSFNLLTEIPNGLFSKMTSFDYFQASDNLITKIGATAFNNVTTQVVSLHNNSISNLKPNFFAGSSIKNMILDLNPLFCDCELRMIAKYVQVLAATCANMPSVTLSTTTAIAGQVCNQCQLNNTCLNGGICIPIEKTNLNCSCINDYTGRFCENESVCRSVTCHHQGVCSPIGEHDYQCRCTDDYSGKNCTVFHKRDQSDLSSTEIAGIVVGVLFLGFLIGAVLVLGKKKNLCEKSEDNRSGVREQLTGSQL